MLALARLVAALPPQRVNVDAAYARVCTWMSHAGRLQHGPALDAHPVPPHCYQRGGRARHRPAPTLLSPTVRQARTRAVQRWCMQTASVTTTAARRTFCAAGWEHSELHAAHGASWTTACTASRPRPPRSCARSCRSGRMAPTAARFCSSSRAASSFLRGSTRRRKLVSRTQSGGSQPQRRALSRATTFIENTRACRVGGESSAALTHASTLPTQLELAAPRAPRMAPRVPPAAAPPLCRGGRTTSAGLCCCDSTY